MRSPEALRETFEAYLTRLPVAATPEAPGLAEAMRYTVDAGGKRLRPVLCLAAGEALGVDPRALLPAAAAVELVHTFSLVHDDLPALDDDATRRGNPSAHVRFGEAVAILAGDALLALAFELASSYERAGPAREVARATLEMIGGQYLDVTGAAVDVLCLHRLKSARLYGAAVGCALSLADVAPADEVSWRAFADAFGRLFQLVDDLADGDGAVLALGEDATRALAREEERHAREALARLTADTSVVAALLDELARRAG